jgi:hypothetical protein
VKGKAKSRETEDYEVFLEFNPKKYRNPGLALINATRYSKATATKESRQEEIVLPLPSPPLLTE